ncbi:MAG: 50S ribosomal protein L3 [Candidatus Heimdallarchaeaceae archaeon]
MVRHSKPRSGTLQFWPRKRARRIYPRVKNWSDSESPKIPGFAGYKAGMLHISFIDTRKNSITKGEEITVPVTVLDCPPVSVVGLRFYSENQDGFYVLDEIWDENIEKDKDIKRKIIIGKRKHSEKFKKIEENLDKIKKIRIIAKTNPRQSGIGKKKPEIFEIEVSGKDMKEKLDYSKELLGKQLTANDIFKEGEFIDVISISKGKGTQGAVKRFGVKIQGRKNKKKGRLIGTLGSEKPGKTPWTIAMSGQMGFQQRTEFNKKILKIGENGKEITPKAGFTGYGIVPKNYIFIQGSIPGARKRLIILRSGIRLPKQAPTPIEIKTISK